jgi:tetratricopeptide (TPR) repeat protein
MPATGEDNSSIRNAVSRKNSYILAAILLLSAALYANTLLNSFAYDDTNALLDNAYIRSFKHLGRIFTTSIFSFKGEDGASNYYRPLFNVQLLLTYQVFGTMPLGYHLVNVLVNVTVVGIVFAVMARLFRDESLALLAAAIFALHPVHTETVNAVVYVQDTQLAAFYLLGFLCFLKLEDAAGRRAAWMHAGMLASFALALLAKEPAITLPVVAVLYEHFCREDREQSSFAEKIRRYGGLWIVAAAYLVVRATVLGDVVSMVKHPEVTWSLVPLNALALLAQYVGKLFWPWPLAIAYPFENAERLSDLRVVAGLVIVLAAVASFVRLWKTSRVHAFALVFLFVTLAPMLNARWMPTYVFAERNLYFASTGFVWLAAAGVLWLWRREWRHPRLVHGTIVATCCVLSLLAAGAILARNRDWHDEHRLYTRNLELYPQASLIRSNLGVWYWGRGRRAEAVREWKLALQSDSQNAFALSNLGLAAIEEKKLDEAAELLNRAMKIRTIFSAPRAYLARVYAAQEKPREAEEQFQRAIAINPWNTGTRNAFGQFFLNAGRLDEAERQFRASVDSIPTEDAWAGLAEVYTRQQNLTQAEAAWKEVTRMNPYHSQAHFALGKLYLAAGRLEEAKMELEAGLLTDPNNAEAREALAKLSTHSKP